MEELYNALYNALQKLVGYEVEAVLLSDDGVQVQFSNGNGVSINLLIDEEGISISDPYAPCHLCCERHEMCGDLEEDEEGFAKDYVAGFDDGYNEGYNDALRLLRKGDK